MDKGKLYFVGCDLGQVNDYTAIGMIEKTVDYDSSNHRTIIDYKVVHLERFTLGTEYPVVVRRLVTMFENPVIKYNGKLIVDQTGVGRAVIDIMKKEGLKPIGITITGGHEIVETPEGYHVPKKELVTALLVLFQSGQLKIARKLPDSQVLVKELENFRVKVNVRTGNETFEAWREYEHDDLVLSVALAAWYGSKKDRYTLVLDEDWKHDEEQNKYDVLGRDNG